jgi:WD40 repeat protein
LLACGCSDGVVKLWEAVRGEEIRTLQSHTAGIGGVGFSPDGRLLASAGLDGKLILTDVRSGKIVQEWQTPHQVLRVAFAPDGRHLLAGNGSGTIDVYRLGPARQ